MKIAEELLLQEDAETLPAKEEKAEPKRRADEKAEPGEAPLLGGDLHGEKASLEPRSAELAEPSQVLQSIVNDGEKAPKAIAGSLAYDMDTVEMLADAPAEPAFDETPAEPAVAKR
jgi:hypothetical protein